MAHETAKVCVMWGASRQWHLYGARNNFVYAYDKLIRSTRNRLSTMLSMFQECLIQTNATNLSSVYVVFLLNTL